jgi:hypothetical protein
VRREYSDHKNYFPEQLPHHPDKPEYNVTDQIQKWGCHFNGDNAIEFLERTEELRKAYGFVGAQLLHEPPELLQGEGLQWFRSITPPKNWTEFKERVRNTYLFGPMRRHISQQIAEREQKDGEPMRIYTREVMTLSGQHGGLSAESILD